jgi:glycosyltransferase involved in cell wall biosynthesis
MDRQGSLVEELASHGTLKKQSRIGNWLFGKEHDLEHRVDRVLVVTDAAQNSLQERLGDRVRKLPDTVDTERFRPMDWQDDLGGKLGLSGDVPVVVYLGLIAPHQGTDLLIDAFSIIKDSGTSAHLLMLGYPNLEEARTRVKDKGLDEQVTVAGTIPYEDAHRYLALGSVAVSPKTSLTEGNGKLLNYMAMGLPTVAFDTPINYELMGDTGILTPVGDVERLADALIQFLDDKDKREQASQAARQRVEEVFSLPVIQKHIANLLSTID